MKRYLGIPALALALAATCWVSLATAAEDKDIETAKKAVLAIAKDLEAGKDVAVAAAKLKKDELDLDAIMTAYKIRAKKGIGFGKGTDQGIESKIQKLAGKGTPNAKTLEEEKDDLIKLAYQNLALGHIMKHYAPEKDKMMQTKKNWMKFTQEMEASTKEFIAAVKGGKPAEVKKAAIKIESSCTDCHTIFRD